MEDALYEVAWTSSSGRNQTIVGNAFDASAWVAAFRDKGAVAVSVTRSGVRMDFPDPLPKVSAQRSTPALPNKKGGRR